MAERSSFPKWLLPPPVLLAIGVGKLIKKAVTFPFRRMAERRILANAPDLTPPKPIVAERFGTGLTPKPDPGRESQADESLNQSTAAALNGLPTADAAVQQTGSAPAERQHTGSRVPPGPQQHQLDH